MASDITSDRIAELERLLGVHQQQRAEFVASLELDNEYDDETVRVARLRRLRANLSGDLAERPDDAETQWRLELVDRAILANTNAEAPEQHLQALQTEHAYLTSVAARTWSASSVPGAPTKDQHDRTVAKAKQAILQVEAQLEQTRAELAKLYQGRQT